MDTVQDIHPASPRPRLQHHPSSHDQSTAYELSLLGPTSGTDHTNAPTLAASEDALTPAHGDQRGVVRHSQALKHVQLFALSWVLFVNGWNDGSTGPLLPRIQSVYHVGFAEVSVVFIANCVGFVSASVTNIWLTDRLGFGKTIVLGAAFQALAYAVQAPAPPFPLFVIGYFLNGIGIGLELAHALGYVASYKDHAALKMGVMQAVYGVGATVSPLVATQFARTSHWSFHYLTSLGLALCNTASLAAVFRFQTQEECRAEIGELPGETGTSQDSAYRQIMSLKAMHLLAAFILVYVGTEVTIGGWIVTYVIEVRGGGSSSGYISSGFFGGLAIGRVGLLYVNHKVGERRALYIYAVLAIILELIVWFVPSLVGGAVAVSLIGFMLGPFYPIAMNHAGRVLPRWLLTACIGWIAGIGQTGSAIFPFITGAIASKAGIRSLQPLLVTMMAMMIGIWALVPSRRRIVD